MSSLQEFFIRMSAFVRKEMAAILRQPRLVAILVLGPFLILLLFGIGYRDSPRTLRTILVVPENSRIKTEIDDLMNRLTGALDIVGTVSSESEALDRLDLQEVDLVLVTPADPYDDILQSQQSQFEVVHQEIDPLEILYVNTLERAYVQEINRQVLVRGVTQAQKRAATVEEKVAASQADAAAVRADLERGDGANALRDVGQLVTDFQALNLSIAASLSMFEGAQSLEKAQHQSSVLLEERLALIERELEDLSLLDPNGTGFKAEVAQVELIEEELAAIKDFFETFQGMSSRVLVSPFAGKTVSVTQVDLGPIDFYVPGVIALLLQHMAVTLAALSIVRERNSGTIELFRAAPLSAMETVLGKMVSFMVLTAVLAAILTALIVFGLKTPLLGTWLSYIAVVLALLFTSLSLGFAISVISQTDSQAVQFSMIVLLASIFFSGFFIALHRLVAGIHIVSWLLPATYGTDMLQDVMLRGRPPATLLMGGLLLWGLVLFIFGWWRLRHLMARE
ncbi:MAG: ABC transporter permease [Anaerolineales bacterium]|nr:ABC transporter permease [Anaerolineales bacterium]